jgi:hypothetical protein
MKLKLTDSRTGYGLFVLLLIIAIRKTKPEDYFLRVKYELLTLLHKPISTDHMIVFNEFVTWLQ